VQQHAASFVTHTEAGTGARLPRFVKDEFDAFLECGILAHGFLRLRCGECGRDTLLAFSCKRRGFCPLCGARCMSQTAAHRVDHVIPQVPVRQWVLSPPIPLRLLLVAQPELITPVLGVVQRVLERHLREAAGLVGGEGQGGAVTLIQRFGSAANLNVHLHCLVLDGVYRSDAEADAEGEEAGTLRPLQAAAVTYRTLPVVRGQARRPEAVHPQPGQLQHAGRDQRRRARLHVEPVPGVMRST
jgi:hypothetical protein